VSSGRLRRALKIGDAGCAKGGICGVNRPVLIQLLKTCLYEVQAMQHLFMPTLLCISTETKQENFKL
jgi:hypothetical protein